MWYLADKSSWSRNPVQNGNEEILLKSEDVRLSWLLKYSIQMNGNWNAFMPVFYELLSHGGSFSTRLD